MNIVELNNLVSKIALACPLVNSYYNESVYECWNTKEVKYGSVVMDVTNIRTTTSTNTFTILFYYGDRLTESKTNKNSVRTDAITVLDSIISKLYEQEGISITYNQSYTLFEQKFEDELAGAYVTVDVQVMGDGMCGFDVEVGSDFEVVQLHETITDNGLYEWKSGKDKYYDQVVIDVDIKRPTFSDIGYLENDLIALGPVENIESDIEYSIEVMNRWDPNITSVNQYFLKDPYDTNIKMIYAPKLDISNITNMSGMFYQCSNMRSIPKFDTGNVTNMSQMFFNCWSLQYIPYIDTSKVTNMSQIFSGCSWLEYIPPLDTGENTSTYGMFGNCQYLRTITQLNTSKVTNMQAMFNFCYRLEYVPQLDASSVRNIYNVFNYCRSLIDFGGFTNLGMSFNNNDGEHYRTLDLSGAKLLNHTSLMNVINNLYDLNLNGQRGILNLGTTNLEKLTSDEITIATNKGWTVK